MAALLTLPFTAATPPVTAQKVIADFHQLAPEEQKFVLADLAAAAPRHLLAAVRCFHQLAPEDQKFVLANLAADSHLGQPAAAPPLRRPDAAATPPLPTREFEMYHKSKVYSYLYHVFEFKRSPSVFRDVLLQHPKLLAAAEALPYSQNGSDAPKIFVYPEQYASVLDHLSQVGVNFGDGNVFLQQLKSRHVIANDEMSFAVREALRLRRIPSAEQVKLKKSGWFFLPSPTGGPTASCRRDPPPHDLQVLESRMLPEAAGHPAAPASASRPDTLRHLLQMHPGAGKAAREVAARAPPPPGLLPAHDPESAVTLLTQGPTVPSREWHTRYPPAAHAYPMPWSAWVTHVAPPPSSSI